MTKEIMVMVRDLNGDEHEATVPNSFDLINNLGWTASGPKTEINQEDIDAAQALIAAASAAKSDADILNAALGNKTDDGKIAPTGEKIEDASKDDDSSIDAKDDSAPAPDAKDDSAPTPDAKDDSSPASADAKDNNAAGGEKPKGRGRPSSKK